MAAHELQDVTVCFPVLTSASSLLKSFPLPQPQPVEYSLLEYLSPEEAAEPIPAHALETILVSAGAASAAQQHGPRMTSSTFSASSHQKVQLSTEAQHVLDAVNKGELRHDSVCNVKKPKPLSVKDVEWTMQLRPKKTEPQSSAPPHSATRSKQGTPSTRRTSFAAAETATTRTAVTCSTSLHQKNVLAEENHNQEEEDYNNAEGRTVNVEGFTCFSSLTRLVDMWMKNEEDSHGGGGDTNNSSKDKQKTKKQGLAKNQDGDRSRLLEAISQAIRSIESLKDCFKKCAAVDFFTSLLEFGSLSEKEEDVNQGQLKRAFQCISIVSQCVAHSTFEVDWITDQILESCVKRFTTCLLKLRHSIKELLALSTTGALSSPASGIKQSMEQVRLVLTAMKQITERRSILGDEHLESLEQCATNAMLMHCTVPGNTSESLMVGEYLFPAAFELYLAMCSDPSRASVKRGAPAYLGSKIIPQKSLLAKVWNYDIGSKGELASVGCLAVVMLGTSQALPFPADALAVPGRLLESSHHTCLSWIQHFEQMLLQSKDNEKEAIDIGHELFAALIEDVAALAALPEFPIGDFALRSLVSVVAKRLVTSAATEKERVLGVDILGRLAARTIRSHQRMGGGSNTASLLPFLTADTTAAIVSPASHSGNKDAALFERFCVKWGNYFVLEQKETEKGRGRGGGAAAASRSRKKKTTHTTDEGEQPEKQPSKQDLLRCLLYFGTSHEAKSLKSCSLWGSARQYHILLWSHDVASADFPSLKLLCDEPEERFDIEDLSAGLQAATDMLRTERRHSFVHPDAVDVLLGFILRVYQQDELTESANWNSSRVKATLHLKQLLGLKISLWVPAFHIARQLALSNSAKARESCISLLETLLSHRSLQSTNNDHRPDKKQTENAKRATPHPPQSTTTAEIEKEDEEESLHKAGLIVGLYMHLLRDNFVSVSGKAISCIANAILGDEGVKKNAKMCQSMLLRLMLAFSTSNNEKHRAEIASIFVRRWFPGHSIHNQQRRKATAVVTGTDEEMIATCRELVLLATQGHIVPYDSVTDPSHELTSLLKFIVERYAEVPEEPSAATTRNTATGTGTTTTKGRKNNNNAAAVAAAEMSSLMLSRMQAVASQLVVDIRNSTSKGENSGIGESREMTMCLGAACLTVLSTVKAEWVLGVLDTLLSQLSSSPSTEHEAAFLLHACLIACQVLRRCPAAPVDKVTPVLTHLIAKYVGPFQQRVLLAAVSALCATIEVGRKATGHRPNESNLCAVYTIMNHQYARTKAIVSASKLEISHIPYALRFVFLLSEFIRSYPWERSFACIGVCDTSPAPNILASDRGVLANARNLFMQLLSVAPPALRGKVLPVVIRGLGSLAMRQPVEYLRTSEPIIRECLHFTETSVQLQGLLLIKEFLIDEDQRVAEANNNLMSLSQQSPSTQDQNSGMSTWLLQKFHRDVERLAGASNETIRCLSFEVVEQAVLQGLLTPIVYIEALIISAAEPIDEQLCMRAERCLQQIYDRFGDTVASKSAAGVLRAFEATCEVSVDANAPVAREVPPKGDETVKNEINNPALKAPPKAYRDCTDLTPHLSVHASLFTMLCKSKRHREGFLGNLMRTIYQSHKFEEWLLKEVRQSSSWETEISSMKQQEAAAAAEASTPLLSSKFLNAFVSGCHRMFYLTETIAFLPLCSEMDCMTILEHIGFGVDLNAESSRDALRSLTAHQSASHADQSETNKKSTSIQDLQQQSTHFPHDLTTFLDVAKAISTCLMLHLKRFVRREYDITPQKIMKRIENPNYTGGSGTTLHRREPNSVASQEFLGSVHKLFDLLSAWYACKISHLNATTDTKKEDKDEEEPPAKRTTGRKAGGGAVQPRGKGGRKAGGSTSPSTSSRDHHVHTLKPLLEILEELIEEESMDGVSLHNNCSPTSNRKRRCPTRSPETTTRSSKAKQATAATKKGKRGRSPAARKSDNKRNKRKSTSGAKKSVTRRGKRDDDDETESETDAEEEEEEDTSTAGAEMEEDESDSTSTDDSTTSSE